MMLTGIPESKHIGGFPVSGLFMVCKNQKVVEQHHAKDLGEKPANGPNSKAFLLSIYLVSR
jgi:malate dehydrogenase (quinone)